MSPNHHKLTLQLSDQKMVETLQKLAESLGYIQTRGGGAGRGSISQLVEAIAEGEVEVSKK